MTRHHRGQNATGGARPAQRFDPDSRLADVGPVASDVGLLQATWAKREHLDERERELVQSLLLVASQRPLSVGQRDIAQKIANCVGAVYEGPLEPVVPAGAVSVQPWGTLPKAPPNRRVA
jgi:hypothetical protein